jgi:hypothetical protein
LVASLAAKGFKLTHSLGGELQAPHEWTL